MKIEQKHDEVSKKKYNINTTEKNSTIQETYDEQKHVKTMA